MKLIYIFFSLFVMCLFTACDYSKTLPRDQYNIGCCHRNAPENTYQFSIQIAGQFNCLTTIIVYQDSSIFWQASHIGTLDTFIKADWYDNQFGLSIEPETCIGENVEIRYQFYH